MTACKKLELTSHFPLETLPRHRHREPYAAVVLAGGYLEAGDGGRLHADPGTVIIHAADQAHLNTFDRATTVLNLAMPTGTAASSGMIRDADAIVRLAEDDQEAALGLLLQQMQPAPRQVGDWPDMLAQAIGEAPCLSITQWAFEHGLSPASVSRGFMRAFGISPRRYRLEARTRHALNAIRQTSLSFTQIAYAQGFADQAHMTRSVVTLAGVTPRMLRQSAFKSG